MTQCEPCTAAWGDLESPEYCDGHTEAVQRLARILAKRVHGGYEPTPEQVGWFMEDAASVVDWIGESEQWDVGRVYQRAERDYVKINGYLFRGPAPNDEGFVALYPSPHTERVLRGEEAPDA